ncbi:glycosyltransferase family 4 protein [Caldimonas brevitalea]|uniref:Glycosyltransferase n=1 Tax=Caldimonas brevitalea TaxID=413882 RepID=A0A0G3BKN9_9BURK|nr:glycosyltransferase family 4 protein [Caldimonas brevitalea]AKJ27926.1 glycosyltransferase [Caldimonas brevitalea]
MKQEPTVMLKQASGSPPDTPAGVAAAPQRATGTSVRRPRAVVVQRRMTHYRLPLFEQMRARLDAMGIELTVVYGDPKPGEAENNDGGDLSWGVHVPCRYLLREKVCWQDPSAVLHDADLIVVTQENNLLFNYLLPMKHRGLKRAFWGHGRNFQALNPNSLSERFKRLFVSRVDWWFAYTDLSADVVVDAGFPRERITVLNNAIDTTALQQHLDSVTPERAAAARQAYGIPPGPIGLMLASLIPDKRPEFLLEAARRVRQQVPDFQLVLVGEGPLRDMIKRAAAESGGWVHWMGLRKGAEKAELLKMSTVMLNPGKVGLNVVDALQARVPMITTDCKTHSPEVSYLRHGVNGLMTADDIDAYANSIAELLRDEVRLDVLRDGCAREAATISIEQMAERFCEGIRECLAAPAKR